MSTDLMKWATIDELGAARARTLDLYARGFALLREALAAHREAAPAVSCVSGLPDRIEWDIGSQHTTPDELIEKMRQRVDRDMWRSVIDATRLGSLMDAQEHDKLRKSLDDNPPPCTPDAITATLERFAAESDMIFRRGLVNAFSNLSREFKSNDGFKLGDRTVYTNGVEVWFGGKWRVKYYATERLADVDRCMHILDGQPAPENHHTSGMVAAINAIEPGESEAVTPYWRVKCHKNGNLHLHALRRDLLDKANRLIAEHFGLKVADDAPRRPSAMDEPTRPRPAADQGDFPSPPAVVSRLLDLAEVGPEMTVLEPSAGAGNLAAACRAAGGVVDCVEIQVRHVEQLNGFHRVSCGDFLDRTPSPTYQRVVMNPPFFDGAAVRHVAHAMRFLAPGGRLVAVMPSSVEHRQDRLHTEFRALVQARGGRFEALPDEAFAESGTGVRTVVLVVG